MMNIPHWIPTSVGMVIIANSHLQLYLLSYGFALCALTYYDWCLEFGYLYLLWISVSGFKKPVSPVPGCVPYQKR